MPPTSLRLRVLGPPVLSSGAYPDGACLLTEPRPLGLLCYLVTARPRGLHTRDTLQALFWPDADAARARRGLRNALHTIRRVIGADALVSEGGALVGIRPGAIACDLLDAEAELREGRLSPHAAPIAPFLDGFHVSGAPRFDEWIDAQRGAAAQVMQAAAVRRCEESLARGDVEGAIRASTSMVELDPLSERAASRLVELLAALGDRAAALRAYEQFAGRLRDQLNAEPSTSLRLLADAVRQGSMQRTQLTQAVQRAVAHPPARKQSKRERAVVCCHRGTFIFLRACHSVDPEGMLQCKELFEEALRHDPDYAPALAGLSNYVSVSATRGLLRPFAEYWEQTLSLSRQTIALDPTLAIPYVHLGVDAMYLRDAWDEAGRFFRQAIAGEPDYAEAHRFLGIWLLALGRHDEARAAIDQALLLEPQIALFRNTSADFHAATGNHTAAVADLTHALRLDPRYGAARDRLLRCLERLGRFEEALAVREQYGAAGSAAPFRAAWQSSAEVGYRAERRREALLEIEAAAKRLPVTDRVPADLMNPPELRLALLHAELGEWDEAAAWQERCCGPRPGRRPWFASRAELRRPTAA